MSTVRYDQLCEQVTNSIVNTIQAGGARTWKAPWHHNGTHDLFTPTNAATGNRYAGANTLVLATEALDAGHPSGLWATYRQWQQLGGQVRRGERGTRCVKWIAKTSATGQTTDPAKDQQRVLVPRVFTVFNIAQVDGYQPPAGTEVKAPDRVATVEAFIAATGADIDYGFNTATYRPLIDRIPVPAIGQYAHAEDHYSTVLHELVHWTGHPSRLNRTFGERFGDHAYAVEELVAELGAAFATAHLGIANRPRPDHAAYISHWLSVLEANPRALFQITARARAAVDHLTAYSQPATESAVAA